MINKEKVKKMKEVKVIDLCDPQHLAALDIFSSKEFKENTPVNKQPNPNYIKCVFQQLSASGIDIKRPGKSSNEDKQISCKLQVVPQSQLSNVKIHSLHALVEDVKSKPYFTMFMKALAKERKDESTQKCDENNSMEKPLRRKRGRPKKCDKNKKEFDDVFRRKVLSRRIAENIKRRALEKIAAELVNSQEVIEKCSQNEEIKTKSAKSLKEETFSNKNSSNNIIQAIVSAVMIKSNNINGELDKKKEIKKRSLKDRSPSPAIVRSDHIPRYKYDTGCDEDRPYPCKYCQGRFTKSSYLKQHIRTHTGERPHKCDVCMRNFREMAALKRHKRTHTGEKPFQCSQCDKCYTDKAVLIEHVRVHTGEKPFLCHICSKPFAYKFSFKQHMKRHKGDRDHHCKMCDAKFYSSACLSLHNKKNHSSHLSDVHHANKKQIKAKHDPKLLLETPKDASSIGKLSLTNEKAKLIEEPNIAHMNSSNDLPIKTNYQEKYHAGEISSEYLTANSYCSLEPQRYSQESRYFIEQQKFQMEFQKAQNHKLQHTNKFQDEYQGILQKFSQNQDTTFSQSSAVKIPHLSNHNSQVEPENLQKNICAPRNHPTHNQNDHLRNEQARNGQQDEKYFHNHHRYIQEIRKYQEPQRYLQELRKFQEAQHGQQLPQQHHQIVASGQSSFRSSAPEQLTSSLVGAFTQHLMGATPNDPSQGTLQTSSMWSTGPPPAAFAEFPPSNISWGGSTMWGQGNFGGYRP